MGITLTVLMDPLQVVYMSCKVAVDVDGKQVVGGLPEIWRLDAKG